MALIEPSPRMTQRDNQRERTRAAILEAALQAFAANGYDGASVRDIAAAAGINHAMIRYHFDGKEELWKAAVDFLFERLNREMALSSQDRRALRDGDLSKFADFLRRYVRYCARHPEHARIMVQECVRDTERLRWAVERHIIPGHVGFAGMIETLQAKGVVPQGSFVSLLYMMVASCQMAFALGAEVRLATGTDMTEEAAIEAHADAVVALFCRAG
jgi:TetR/AcrR family transcriptional regulator